MRISRIFCLVTSFILLVIGTQLFSSSKSVTGAQNTISENAADYFLYLPLTIIQSPQTLEQWSQIFTTTGSYVDITDVLFTSDREIIAFGTKRVDYDTTGLGMKLSPVGEIIWQKYYPFIVIEIQESSPGEYLLFGRYSDMPFVTKMDDQGSVVWAKSYGESIDSSHMYASKTADGGYILGADTEQFQALDIDIWLLKMDGNGEIIWQKTYGTEEKDYLNGLDGTADGGIVVSGTRLKIIEPYDFYVWSLILFKLDANGNTVWQKEYFYCGLPKIIETHSGDILIAGSNDFGNGVDGCVAKLNSQGDWLWFKSYGTSEERDDNFKEVLETTNGDYLIAGLTPGDGLLMRLSSDGEIIWQKSIGGDQTDRFIGLDVSIDGDIVTSGHGFGQGGWITKLDANGHIPLCPSLVDHSAVASTRTLTVETLNLTVQDTAVNSNEITITSVENADATSNFICPNPVSRQYCTQE